MDFRLINWSSKYLRKLDFSITIPCRDQFEAVIILYLVPLLPYFLLWVLMLLTLQSFCKFYSTFYHSSIAQKKHTQLCSLQLSRPRTSEEMDRTLKVDNPLYLYWNQIFSFEPLQAFATWIFGTFQFYGVLLPDLQISLPRHKNQSALSIVLH